jgi:hypothetical protein
VFTFGYVRKLREKYKGERQNIADMLLYGEEHGYEWGMWPTIIAHCNKQITLDQWAEVCFILNDMDTLRNGYVSLFQPSKAQEQGPSEMLPYDLLLLQAHITMNDILQEHFFVVRKFQGNEPDMELWICLDSLHDTRPFVVALIDTFLFGARTCTYHLLTKPLITRVADNIIVYGVKAPFLDKTF